MVRPYIIGIAGESGVGKSTIAEIISLFYGAENTTVISTDDLHKWERTNPMWKNITHLNPEANNLELGDIHLSELMQGRSIFRSIYNHKTGNFNPPVKIEPRKIIIVEGLHAFFTDVSKNNIDMKIYVDTNEDLKCHWKIIRDTEERGYKYNSVLDAINKRRKDACLIRNAQIDVADVVVVMQPKQKITYLGDCTEKVELSLSYHFQKERSDDSLFSFIQEYVSEFDVFSKTSENIGEDISLCQETGGNISVKLSKNLMLIKSSGTKMKDVRKYNYSIVNYQTLINEISSSKDDDSMNLTIKNSVALGKYKRPSMETAFHAILDKYVIHTHPIYLTLLLCLENSKHIISELFKNLDYAYIEYSNPGYDLYKKIHSFNAIHQVYFLENHGVIISSNDINFCSNLLNMINYECKKYIESKCDFEEFNISFAIHKIDDYVFPDAVVFSQNIKEEIVAAHNYVTIFGKQIGKLRYLSYTDVSFLQLMESEKYRATT